MNKLEIEPQHLGIAKALRMKDGPVDDGRREPIKPLGKILTHLRIIVEIAHLLGKLSSDRDTVDGKMTEG